jgi:tetratricopeptide (TPR) repeat protein
MSDAHDTRSTNGHDAAERIDRLLDAIDLIKAGRREEARAILRDLIRHDSDFEEAWLWMSVAVESLDQSSLSLENVLRVNPGNYDAAGALYRIRIPDIQMERRQARLRLWRDVASLLLWAVIMLGLLAVMLTYVSEAAQLPS